MAIKFSEMVEKTTALDYEDLACVSEFDAIGGTYTTKKIKGFLIQDGVFNGNVTGSFCDLKTQMTLANTPTPMILRETLLSNFCSIVDDTKITTNQTGVFNVQFSAQLNRTSGGTNAHVDIWFALNGVNIDNSYKNNNGKQRTLFSRFVELCFTYGKKRLHRNYVDAERCYNTITI